MAIARSSPLFGCLVFWIAGVGAFWAASDQDALKPNNAFVIRAAEWVGCAQTYVFPVHPPGAARAVPGFARIGESQRDCFERQPEGRAFPEFNALVYSLDTLLPLVDFEIQDHWLPDEDKPYGLAARIYLWLHIGVGWLLSLLAVAGFSGLVKSD